MELFGSSGVRGVVGEDLTTDLAVRVAGAAAAEWGADRVAVARDTRTSGRLFADAAAVGLSAAGADVDRLGVVPTPGVAHYCETEAVPGVVVTASHNPPEYNGLKLVGADGVELAVPELERVEDRIADPRSADWTAVGDSRRVEDANDGYAAAVCDAVDRDRIAAAGLTVAVDPGHGAGALTSPRIYRELGCRVVSVNGQPDGRFPGRDPEPIPENIDDLRGLVRASGADLGIAHDGDADRAVFVDERGEYVEGDASLAALAAAELGDGDVAVAAVNVSRRLVDICEAAGARLELTPIGTTNIVTRVRDLRADGHRVAVAGEGNGGVLFPDYRLVRDGAYTAARFLELVADRPASEVVTPHDDHYNDRRGLRYDGGAERDAMLEAAAEYAAAAEADLDTTDGYRLDYADGWVLVRESGTEPKVRIYAEADDPDRAAELADGVQEALAAATEG